MAFGPVVCCRVSQDAHCAATLAMLAGTAVDAAILAAVIPAGTSAPQAGRVDRPAVSEVLLGSAVNGVKSGCRVNAASIGLAAVSFWFIGRIPRICSMVRSMVICE